MAISVEEFLSRFKTAKSRKTNWAEMYEEALEYAAPYRETFDEATPGEIKDGKGLVFDSTAQDALQKFASNIQSSMTPAMRTWSNFRTGSSVDPEDEELKKALKQITEVVFSQIQNSNFDVQIAESYLDLAVGTGALLVQRGPNIQNPLVFNNVPLSQLFLEEGPMGRIDTAFRPHKVEMRNIKKTWPDAKFNTEMDEVLSDRPDKKVDLIEATFQDKIKVLNKETNTLEEVDGFRYMVLSKKHRHIIVEREEKSNPWIIFRWSTIPGEIYGRGPLLFSLPDIKSLNKTKELTFQAASIGIFGMYTVQDDGVINIENIKLGPGSMIPVESNGSARGKTIEPLASTSRVDLSQIIIADLKQAIKDMMLVDPIGPIDLPVKTATEVSLRQQDLAKRIGSSFGRLQFELITPLLNRILDILDDWGLVDLGTFRIDGSVIAIQHVSPLALAQTEEEFTNMVRFAETLVGLFGPQVAMSLINPDEFSKISARKLNVDEKLVPTNKQFEAMKKVLAQAVQQTIPQ